MPPHDDETGYSRDPLPRGRSYGYDEDDYDDEPLPPRRPRRGARHDEPAGVITSLGTVGMVLGVLHIIGSLALCLTGTVFAGMFVGMGQMIANEQRAQGLQGQQVQGAVDVCNGFGLFTGVVTLAPAFVYALGAIGLLGGSWGVVQRQNTGRIVLLVATPIVFVLDTATLVVNPVSGAIAAALALAYGVFAYIVLLMPDNVDEFHR